MRVDAYTECGIPERELEELKAEADRLGKSSFARFVDISIHFVEILGSSQWELRT